MTKKAIFALVLVGAVFAARPAVKRVGQKMTEHCEQMAAQCKQMLAQAGGREEATGGA